MKKTLLIVLIGVLFLVGCTPINQGIIDVAVMNMKFKDKGEVTTEAMQKKIEEHCKALIYEPNGFIVNYYAYLGKMKYAYQDCMAAYGYICTE